MKTVEDSTTTLTFTALSLPDGVFTSTIYLTVTPITSYGKEPVNDKTAIIHGKMMLF